MSKMEKKFTYSHLDKDGLPAPKTPEERCYHYRWLDQHFGTDTDSPLHHNHRCVLCGEKRRKARNGQHHQ
ncbi:hypothetical protein SEA_OTTERSTEDTS21_53 [Gordonia phage OtterstedtS21]|uniref:Uncharacterized protein n=4 Tax=Lambovirus TaxID=2843412 RepID=A0A9E7TYQ7_9CAUD|nr:hypothetical protein HWC69_gp054 [Gordonia phage Ranch]YP_009854009.1 hypothetical protein HWC82_gp55 [Gordonia phage Yikes]UVT31216.1 hypothetical protein SEA_OTTERSTEDTS21_53 [Gordonia phage OtterstedtS21]UVT31749.1 hypothetical protein SEA_PATOS_56 [Gordonia phage Patos]WNN95313.1 hypothetical protein SEA_NORMANRE_56 [Gordonia phage NorManre]QFG12363.1 hypothetical protein PBI_RANCH_54 [Gordonia phage Ranch]QGJ91043.1 hypothetical protein PBI_YIKES_55 [Gordonia phage Yikes]